MHYWYRRREREFHLDAGHVECHSASRQIVWWWYNLYHLIIDRIIRRCQCEDRFCDKGRRTFQRWNRQGRFHRSVQRRTLRVTEERMVTFTFPLGKPSSFKISKIRFSVLPEANVLLMLKGTKVNQTKNISTFLFTFEREFCYWHSA